MRDDGVNPRCHESAVEDVRLKACSLGYNTRHNCAGSRSELPTQRMYEYRIGGLEDPSKGGKGGNCQTVFRDYDQTVIFEFSWSTSFPGRELICKEFRAVSELIFLL